MWVVYVGRLCGSSMWVVYVGRLFMSSIYIDALRHSKKFGVDRILPSTPFFIVDRAFSAQARCSAMSAPGQCFAGRQRNQGRVAECQLVGHLVSLAHERQRAGVARQVV